MQPLKELSEPKTSDLMLEAVSEDIVWHCASAMTYNRKDFVLRFFESHTIIHLINAPGI